MAGEEKNTANIECVRLHAAYEALCGSRTKENYIAFMQTVEADLRADAYAFVPVQSAMPVAVAPNGKIRWNVTTTPAGQMLTVFTSREQAERFPAPASACVRLSACVREALAAKNLVGILFNPADGHHGVPVQRDNLQVLKHRLFGLTAEGVPRLHPNVVSEAVLQLFKVAVGVPTPVYDIASDLQAFGGPDALMKEILAKFEKTGEGVESGSPDQKLRTVLVGVMREAFVAGAFVRKDIALARNAESQDCFDKVPLLAQDINQNVDEYLVIISDIIRVKAPKLGDDELLSLFGANVNLLAFGAMSFAFGWGIARYCEGLGPEALKELKERQRAFLAAMKAQAEKQQAAAVVKKE